MLPTEVRRIRCGSCSRARRVIYAADCTVSLEQLSRELLFLHVSIGCRSSPGKLVPSFKPKVAAHLLQTHV